MLLVSVRFRPQSSGGVSFALCLLPLTFLTMASEGNEKLLMILRTSLLCSISNVIYLVIKFSNFRHGIFFVRVVGVALLCLYGNNFLWNFPMFFALVLQHWFFMSSVTLAKRSFSFGEAFFVSTCGFCSHLHFLWFAFLVGISASNIFFVTLYRVDIF